MQENFKDVPGCKGIYQVSDQGRVKSFKYGDWRLLNPWINNTGYFMVDLHFNKKEKTIQVHQLVAITFLGHKPSGYKIVVDHINNIKTDNRVSNLQLISHRENATKDKWRYNSSSKYIGVSWNKALKKWNSRIHIEKKYIHLGYFNTELEANEVYQKALSDFNKGLEVKGCAKFSSKYKGVSFKKENKKWRAGFKRKYLGYFTTELEAHEAYQYYLKHGRRIQDSE